ncbi:MAG: DUF393 domain-containing protein [Chlamydiae bacterium]|nr:DUF393 domain-containing protein [Chlamydiota bacterium]
MKKKKSGDNPLSMIWEDLMFINFSVEQSRLQKLLPKGMEVDLFKNNAYITIAPLTMKGFAYRKLSTFFNPSFYECNLRTYVRVNDKPGVYFFSLDAASFLEVIGARSLFHLNYRYRKISFALKNEMFCFEISSPTSSKKTTVIEAKISKEKQVADPLIQFISDRSSYFVKNKKHIYEGKVSHADWKFQKVEELKLQTDLLNGFNASSEMSAVYAKHTVVEANFIQPSFLPILFYDRDCGLCSLAVRTLLFLDFRKYLRFAPLEGKTYNSFFMTPPKKDRLHLLEDIGKSDGAQALLRILDYLPWFMGVFAVFKLFPLKTLNRWYDWVAKKRKNCPLKPQKIDDERSLP